ncbi:MAG: hypothetical protein RJQ14_08915, partial [Marinoscillum sp.]
MKHLSLCLILCFAMIVCRGQDWATSYQNSIDAYSNYQSQQAREFAEQALSEIKAEQPTPSKNQAVILRQLSLICYDLGDDPAAI